MSKNKSLGAIRQAKPIPSETGKSKAIALAELEAEAMAELRGNPFLAVYLDVSRVSGSRKLGAGLRILGLAKTDELVAQHAKAVALVDRLGKLPVDLVRSARTYGIGREIGSLSVQGGPLMRILAHAGQVAVESAAAQIEREGWTNRHLVPRIVNRIRSLEPDYGFCLALNAKLGGGGKIQVAKDLHAELVGRINAIRTELGMAPVSDIYGGNGTAKPETVEPAKQAQAA